jgi:Family of unknown function (DUF6056)
MTRTADRAASVLALAAIVVMSGALVGHALQVSPSTDDFCNRLIATSQSLPAAVLTAYSDWTGRVVTTTVLYATLAAFDLFGLAPVGLALAMLFIVAAMQVATLATLGSSKARVPVAAFAMVAMMLGLRPLTGQAVFWITGGIVYTVALVLLLAWLISMRRLFHDNDQGFGALSGFAFGVLVGNAIELIVPIALVYGGSMLWLKRAQLTPAARRVAFWRLGGVVAGALILGLAPGNLKRAAATAGSLGTDTTILGAELQRMMSTMFDVGAPMLASVAIVACIGAWLARSRESDDRPAAIEAVVFVLGAIASLLPVLLAPAQFTPRNLYFALVVLLVAVLAFAIPALSRLRAAPIVLAAIAFAGAIGSAIVYGRHIEEARAIRASLTDQDRRLREAARAGLRDVVVPPVRIVPPPTVHFIELAADASRWDNRCVARYYGLASVRIADEVR